MYLLVKVTDKNEAHPPLPLDSVSSFIHFVDLYKLQYDIITVMLLLDTTTNTVILTTKM